MVITCLGQFRIGEGLVLSKILGGVCLPLMFWACWYDLGLNLIFLPRASPSLTLPFIQSRFQDETPLILELPFFCVYVTSPQNTTASCSEIDKTSREYVQLQEKQVDC